MNAPGARPDNGEIVRWAYRLLLGREPESPAVIEGWKALPPRQILDAMAGSAEAESCRAAGFPVKGSWIHQKLSDAAVHAAHLLLHDASPSAPEIDAALQDQDSLVGFRAGFLARVYGDTPLAEWSIEPRRFVLLDQDFTLRGLPGDRYWDAMAKSLPDRGAERLARVVRAAFPDGGAGRVLVDAGANIGLASLALAAGAPYHAALLAAEPDPRCTALLRDNLAANALTEAQVLEAALGAEDGVATMRLEDDNTAVNYVIGERSYAPAQRSSRAEVPLRRLDTVLAERGLERLDLLKIDVEGAETDVMLGAAEAIRRDRPLVFAEFNIWTQMAVALRNPVEVLEEWREAFPGLVIFDHDGRPVPVRHRDTLLWWLHRVLTEQRGVDDLVLCHDLLWLEHWA